MGQSCIFEEEKLNWIWTSRDSESFEVRESELKVMSQVDWWYIDVLKFFFALQKHCKTALRDCYYSKDDQQILWFF